ncbi:MAG: MoxR family ATPase, partial [Myxococcota bacterium]
HVILDRTTSEDTPKPEPVIDRSRLLQMRDLIRRVPLSRNVQDYAIRVLQATHPDSEAATEMTRKYVRYGGSPRGVQAMILAAKTRSLLEGRYAVAIDDIRTVAALALRHRIILNFEGEAEGVDPDQIIADILENTAEAV